MVPRPYQLAGDGSAFAFHPPTDNLSPAVREVHLLYARKVMTARIGELVILVRKEGPAVMGFVVSRDGTGHTLDTGRGGPVEVPHAALAELAEIVLVDRIGRPAAVRTVAAKAA